MTRNRLQLHRCAAVICYTVASTLAGHTPVRADVADAEAQIGTFLQNLRAQGAEVEEGVFRFFTPDDCSDVAHCWINNPSTPYGFFLLPPGPGEPDPDPDARGPQMSNLRSVFRLRPDEAIVFIGRTPPPVPYFSFTPYVFSRFDPTAPGPSPYADRAEVYASLADSLNHLVLHTAGPPTDNPFRAEIAIIFTADRRTDGFARAALTESGFPTGMINTVVIPRFKADVVTPLARMGYENEADLFSVLLRVADLNPGEPGELRDWLVQPGGRVFRARPGHGDALVPFPFPELRPRGTGQAESGNALARLTRRIADHYGARATIRTTSPAIREDGYQCLDEMRPCYADCRDTPYMKAIVRFGAAPEAFIVVGQNHEATGKASYVNITVTRVSDGTASFSVVLPDLHGSVGKYVPRDRHNDVLWQVKFARNCRGERFCYEITEEQVPVGTLVSVIVRAYLEPATRTAPKVLPANESELAWPRLILLNHDRNELRSPR